MATYKLIQDIEAEDHILGPLSLRQFIYALIGAFLYYICFFLFTKGVAFLAVFLLPPALFFTFFAFPFGKDQSTEVWALAKLRFIIKPNRRIWDQSGVKELVTITVPKKIEHILTDGLSQREVISRLNALASTLDSRGWAIKNVVATRNYADPFSVRTSDRLVDPSSLPREVPSGEVYASDDILDSYASPVSQHFDTMIAASEKDHRQQIMNKMNDVALAERIKPTSEPEDYWFMNQPPASSLAPNETMFAGTSTIQPGPPTTQAQAQTVTAEEQAVIDQVKAKSAESAAFNSRMKILQPTQTAPVPAQNTPTPATTPVQPPSPAIIQTLASNNDLDVATLARQAKKELHEDDGEVVISLH